jgi:hypothetical protein
MRSPHHVDALVEEEMLGFLRWHFDKQLTVLSAQGDAEGRIPVRIGGHHVEQIAGQIAGWGSRITVTGPPEARAYLAKIGSELVTSYS